ncbi:MAG TPA: antibiotic biosynthesis monooxygenase family protein [Actinomycetota bacterium]|nr:antibiotic biosynthesis monooxygenase family protein [Actinomycetota bacterium]
MSECLFIGRFQIKDGKQEDFGQVAKRIMAAVAKEPGVKRYDWYEGKDGAVMAVEIYVSGEAVMEHMTGEAGALLPEIFEFADVVGIDLYGEPGATVREAMAAFPITYYPEPTFSPGG